MGGATIAPPPSPLHSANSSRCTVAFNRLFAAVYGGAILALFYHHHRFDSSKFLNFIFLNLSCPTHLRFNSGFHVADGAMFSDDSGPPPRVSRAGTEDLDFQAVDVFIYDGSLEGAADERGELGTTSYGLRLSFWEDLRLYLRRGGSALTLFALMAAAQFASHWLPVCSQNDAVERNPEFFFWVFSSSSRNVGANENEGGR
ncbi:unnamed protein product [Citrullus colocynthis]|uniref:CASP-like protein n=1 Tax=Citrullus colocynthis TaxID=252529 RepID=A0ABP0Z1E5_9ROSI